MSGDRYQPISLGYMILGTIERIPRKWVARGPDAAVIGVHKTRRGAVDAILAQHLMNPNIALQWAAPASFAVH
ncbi:hypothetical protein OZ411_01200 [Bradyrhizobium sp. Arg237L]|uniref:hypothetical protein n=1 Tax=Bradyrhizobium sp. Arg237L TaxID=3003352 RepID=UPI00249DEE2F|nr:hypothetical protein [Bradyrhizobium sp. Arg237L]MDI4231429.1 hypothetical protein [Bradyrhizobium sp. Arg237L]